jgi:iron(III) transport system ATP-binding protein
VLLLDEPFSSLDADLRVRVRVEVKAILANAGATVIFVTHDQEEALFMGEKVGVMNQGQLEQLDTPENIFHSPATPFIAQFVGIADFLGGTVQGKVIVTEIGRLTFRDDLPDGTIVRVMIRPDFIDIRPDEDGVGVIVDRVFQGIHYLYQVQLSSGATLRSLQHHNREYATNTRVSIKMNPGHRARYFADGKTES